MIWKRLGADHMVLVLKNQKESGQRFTLEIVFETLRRMQVKLQRKINIIREDGATCSNTHNIANKIADTFNKISYPTNYCEEFKQPQNTDYLTLSAISPRRPRIRL